MSTLTIKNSSGEALEGVVIQYRGKIELTNAQGKYSISIPAKKETKIVFSLIGYISDSLVLNLDEGEVKESNFTFTPKENVLTEVNVTSKSRPIESGTDLKPRELEFNTGPLSTVEGLIKTQEKNEKEEV